MYAGSRLVHLPMRSLEPRCFRRSSSILAADRSCAFGFVLRPCSIRLATNRSRDVPHLIGWARELGPHRLSTMPSSPASLLPMVVASKCSHLAMSSLAAGHRAERSSGGALYLLGRAAPRNEILFWKTSPAMNVILDGKQFSPCDDPRSP